MRVGEAKGILSSGLAGSPMTAGIFGFIGDRGGLGRDFPPFEPTTASAVFGLGEILPAGPGLSLFRVFGFAEALLLRGFEGKPGRMPGAEDD